MKTSKSYKITAGSLNIVAAFFITALIAVGLVKVFIVGNLSEFYRNVFFIPPLFIICAIFMSLPLFLGISVGVTGGLMAGYSKSRKRLLAFAIYSLVCETLFVLITISTTVSNASALLHGYSDVYTVLNFIFSAGTLLTATAAIIFNCLTLCEAKSAD